MLKRHILALTAFLNVTVLSIAAQAQLTGGITKVNTFLTNMDSVLNTVSITTVTIAVCWTGYKMMFKHAHIQDCVAVLGGGLLVAAASQVAAYLLQ